ncbi:MAG: DUF5107 domain-containing protein [Bryobacterales bacterium]|nr:DUF5107 domain-containing protein [Bryobacterales bacterium]
MEKSYIIIYLENEYLRIAVLPEIGGRLVQGISKTNNYHFIYRRQHVIKPALIGLIGAWISGGIEWNIPHHHRASTFIPVQDKPEEGSDGAKTVWVENWQLRDQAMGGRLYAAAWFLLVLSKPPSASLTARRKRYDASLCQPLRSTQRVELPG